MAWLMPPANEEQALKYKLNPVDNLEPLARAKIPVVAVCGAWFAVELLWGGNGLFMVLTGALTVYAAWVLLLAWKGIAVSALAIPQCCISSAVAAIVRDAGAAQFAHWLDANGIEKGDRIAFMLEPSLPFYVCLFGAMQTGAISVPLFTLFGASWSQRPGGRG